MVAERALKFAEWFEEQFGSRPSSERLEVLRREARDAQRDALDMATIVENVEKWERMRDQCLTAWTAARDSK